MRYKVSGEIWWVEGGYWKACKPGGVSEVKWPAHSNVDEHLEAYKTIGTWELVND